MPFVIGISSCRLDAMGNSSRGRGRSARLMLAGSYPEFLFGILVAWQRLGSGCASLAFGVMPVASEFTTSLPRWIPALSIDTCKYVLYILLPHTKLCGFRKAGLLRLGERDGLPSPTRPWRTGTSPITPSITHHHQSSPIQPREGRIDESLLGVSRRLGYGAGHGERCINSRP